MVSPAQTSAQKTVQLELDKTAFAFFKSLLCFLRIYTGSVPSQRHSFSVSHIGLCDFFFLGIGLRDKEDEDDDEEFDTLAVVNFMIKTLRTD